VESIINECFAIKPQTKAEAINQLKNDIPQAKQNQERIILIPGNLDIRHNKRHLSRKANELYQQNKHKLLDAEKIEIQGCSFGGLNTFVFLAAISRDNVDGQKILDKITNIHLIDPLPNIGQSRIGKCSAACLWIVKVVTCNWGKSPSIRKYIETIEKNDCKLNNATVHYYQADNDKMINHTPFHMAKTKARFGDIVKECNNYHYRGKHATLNTEITKNGIKIDDKVLIQPKLRQEEFEIGGKQRFEQMFEELQQNNSLQLDVDAMSDVDEGEHKINIMCMKRDFNDNMESGVKKIFAQYQLEIL